jgi:hypothetical protein
VPCPDFFQTKNSLFRALMVGSPMDDEGRAELKKKIIEEIEVQKHLIISFTLTSKPVAPDNAIGRFTRMETINSQGINEASLN